MGFFKKFADMARANINSLIDQLEDPKKMSDQAVLDLHESKKKALKLLVATTAALKMAESTKQRLEKEIKFYEQEAENFLKQQDEERAKDALMKKQMAQQELAICNDQLVHEQKTVETINRGLLAMDEKIQALKISAGVQASKHELEKDDAFTTFARMEEKIESKEFEVEALNELLASEQKKDASEEPPAKASFDKHSDPAALERELAAMKKRLNDS